MADDLGIGDLGCYGNRTLRYNGLVMLVVLGVVGVCVGEHMWVMMSLKAARSGKALRSSDVNPQEITF